MTWHAHLLHVATLLTDPDVAEDAQAMWRGELAVLTAEPLGDYPTPLAYSSGVLRHTLLEFRRWPELAERHRYALVSLGVRLAYSAMLLLLLGLATADLIHGHLVWLAGLLVMATPAPSIYSRWNSDPYGLSLPRLRKVVQLRMIKVGIGGAMLLILVGPWIAKLYMLLIVGYVVNAIYGERLRDWWGARRW